MTMNRRALSLVSPLLPTKINDYLLDRFSKRLKAELCDKVTDDFLEFLLGAMEVAFILSPNYRENIRDLHGTFVFGTANGRVATTALFSQGKMRVDDRAITPCDVRITFADSQALWSFLLSENQDVLDSILQNTVDVEGNLNYLYRFGFLARDLTRRIGVA